MTSFKTVLMSAALLVPAVGCVPLEKEDDSAATAGAITGTASRPLLTSTEAGNFTVLKYLAQAGSVTSPSVDNWNPTAGVGNVSGFTATYTVAASGGTHTSVQAAINAATGSNRVYIKVMPGTYREVVCITSSAPPITLYSTSSDASQTVIVYNNYAGKTKAETAPANVSVTAGKISLTDTNAPAIPAPIVAPARPASEMRELAVTSVTSLGSSLGTAEARVTPYAFEATRQPSAAKARDLKAFLHWAITSGNTQIEVNMGIHT